MIAQPSNSDVQTSVIYVGFCWSELAQDIDYRFSSLRLADTAAAMGSCLAKTNVPEEGYKEFLLARLGAWSGDETLVITLAHHRIVMFAVPLAR